MPALVPGRRHTTAVLPAVALLLAGMFALVIAGGMANGFAALRTASVPPGRIIIAYFFPPWHFVPVFRSGAKSQAIAAMLVRAAAAHASQGAGKTVKMDAAAVIDHLQQWMRNYAQGQDKKGFVVGVSGGVDSAVASAVAARTGLTVICMELPIHQAKDEEERATEHVRKLVRAYDNVERIYLDLTQHFDAFEKVMGEAGDDQHAKDLAYVNTKSRLRLAALYYQATARNLLVVGTGNRVEQRGVGFFAKYGDGGMDLAPFTKLLKSEMYELARELKVGNRITDAPPTDGLWPDGRTDLDQMGATYPELEWAMDLREGGADMDNMELDERQREVLEIYDKRHGDTRHKQLDPPEGPVPRSIRWGKRGKTTT